MANQSVDILIVGSGEAGKYLAWTMAQAGRRTVVVERKLIGGSCPNIACLPSKNIIHSAKIAQFVRHASEYGIAAGEPTIDMAGVRQRKRQMVDGLIELHLGKYGASGAELLMGEARFIGSKTIEVRKNDGGIVTVMGENVCLNVGTQAAMPEVSGLRESKPLTHVEALELDRSPAHMLVVGGGFVGLELAQAFRRFGSKVTIVERGPQLAGQEDADVASEILCLFQDEGIEVLLNTEVVKVEGLSGQGVKMRVRDPQGERVIEGSDILVAAGRVPNTAGVGLENAGVDLDGRGYIRVDERLQTTAPGVWAMGECAGSPQFTHVAYDDFRIVHENLTGGSRTTTNRLIPFCLFTDPEFGRVGLSENEARKRGIRYRLAKIPAAAVLRTRTLSETRGFLKAIVSDEGNEILGFSAFCVQASEPTAVVQTAMLAKLPYTALRDAIFTHPTMAEGLTALFAATPSRPKATEAASYH